MCDLIIPIQDIMYAPDSEFSRFYGNIIWAEFGKYSNVKVLNQFWVINPNPGGGGGFDPPSGISWITFFSLNLLTLYFTTFNIYLLLRLCQIL